MSIVSTLYRVALRRTSTLVLLCTGGVFFFERTFDLGADSLFEYINRGKLWKDIEHKYEQ